MTMLTTARLRLEPINDTHYSALRAINTDPEVMTYLNGGQPETEEVTRAAISRTMGRWMEWGYSWWVLVRLADEQVIGMACLQHLDGDRSKAHEIGWRLARAGWGQKRGQVANCYTSSSVDLMVLIGRRACHG